ncbi:uncharacterized protein LOC116163743 isoform X2 [Photinus pyralis]|uniref:uncharacterized protein LOC116163743 isoform X2 n=1 Tax=Photinus pyralis TaxID=7054 RepID=UPI001266EADD|nr:uncharacterized protein LOC116163743 isoform X2 [Photinus pyralis]
MDDLYKFMVERGVAEQSIVYFKAENIDSVALQIIDDDKLKEWIPRYGDRVAIKDYCRQKTCARRSSLIERLRLKLQSKDTKTSGNDNKKVQFSRKNTRIIEIGWLCNDNVKQKLTQVRAKQGGGTRKLSVPKTCLAKDIFVQSQNLFFPDGKSTKEDSATVDSLFKDTGITRLRFYLASESLIPKQPSNGTNQANKSSMFMTSDDSDIEDVLASNLPSTSSNLRRSSRLENSENNITNYYQHFYDTEALEDQGMLLNNIPIEDTFSLDLTAFDADRYNLSPDPVQNVGTVIAGVSNNILVETKLLRLHRGKIFEELIKAFEDETFATYNLQVEMILPNGDIEIASDMGGVLRDALSEFWQDFYEKCTLGTTMKVPYIRHDFGEIQWKAVARIVVFGWKSQKYFPIRIAPIFMLSCLGYDSPEEKSLIPNFLKYISESECELLKNAVDNFDDTNKDDLLEILSGFDTKWLPSKDNIKQLIIDIAHKEIIQKPSFVAKCIRPHLESVITKDDLEKIYGDLEPTTKNILGKIEIKKDLIMTANMTKVYDYLKRYIKEMDLKTRSAFLRFCTGSDLITRIIEVSFTTTNGFQRTPVAHTCTGLLELPCTYDSFVDFRSEFNSLLNSNIWVMDII